MKVSGLLIGGLVGLAQALPFPGQQFVQTRRGKNGDASQGVGEPGFRVDVVEACRGDEGEHDGGAVGAALGPAKVQLRRPRRMPRNALSAALLLRQILPSSRKRAKSAQRLSM